MTPAPFHRQAYVQREILLRLEESPATSVSLLAHELGSSRPSVSRALHAMKAKGWIEFSEGRWSIVQVPAGVGLMSSGERMDFLKIALRAAGDNPRYALLIANSTLALVSAQEDLA